MLTQVRNQTTENELIVPPLHDSPVSKLIQVPNLQSKEHNLSRKIYSFLFSKVVADVHTRKTSESIILETHEATGNLTVEK